MATTKRDLLTLVDLSLDEIARLFMRTKQLKDLQQRREVHQTLKGRVLGMIFEKPSTRTRVSFETGMFQLGGHALFLSSKDIQLGRGENLSDSARVLSRYVDCLMVRTFAHENVVTIAHHATVPVINGLSDSFHPCQVLTDIFTFAEQRGPISGRTVAWVGDGNNMAHSWILAAAKMGIHLRLACPSGYEPDPAVLAIATAEGIKYHRATPDITILHDPREAVNQADLVITDTWTSMGQEEERQRRLRAFAGYTVDRALLSLAAPDALFMHCLPAHRGEEVTSEILDGPNSVVWDEAENRLHVQKAILEWLIGTE